MSIATIPLISFYNYDNSIFDYLNLPEGLDKDSFIYLLLQRYGEFEIMYTDFDFVKESIKYWSIANQSNFKRLYDTISAEYNPIENYDRYEDILDTSKSSGNIGSNSTNNEKVSGYDSNELVDNSENKTNSATNSSSNAENKHTAHIHGNIGVTTSSAMQKEVLALYKANNIYSIIAEMFAEEYLILVY